MNFLATIDPELAAVIGAIGAIITTLGTIWIKNRHSKSKVNTDDVNNTIRLTDTMNNVIDMLEKELEVLSKRIEECRTAIKERDDLILELRKNLHDAEAELHQLRGGDESDGQ